MVLVMLFASEVALLTAVTVTVPVTLALCELVTEELLLPPPHPVMTAIENKASAPSGRRACFLTAKRTLVSASPKTPKRKTRLLPPGKFRFQNEAEAAVAFEMVKVALPVPVTVPGMAQVVFERVDGTEQVNETVPEKPPTGVTVTVEVPEEELVTVSVDGLTLSV